MALIATIFVIVGIVGLFRLDRDQKTRVSKALWIPTIYVLLISSRPVTDWMGVNQSISPEDGIYSDPVGQAIDLALLALGVAVLISRRRKVLPILQTNAPVLLYFSYAALSILWSDFPFVTLKHWIKGVEDLVIVLIVLTDRDPLAALRRLLTRTGFLLIPLSLLFSMYYPNLGRIYTKSWETEYVGVTDQKNQLGVICMIFGLASLWRLLRAYRDRENKSRKRYLLVHGTMLGMTIWLLQMSQSLTSSVCLVLTGTVMALVSGRILVARSVRVHLLSLGAVCCALIPLFLARSLVEHFGRDTTLSGRTEIWDAVRGLVRNPWLGAGYESFLMGPRLVELRAQFQTSFQEAHNGYLEIYLNLGWTGVCLFALVLVTGYQKVIALLRREPEVGSLALALLIAIAMNGLTEAPFRMMTSTCFFLLWAIVGASKTFRPRRSTVLAVGGEMSYAISAQELAVRH